MEITINYFDREDKEKSIDITVDVSSYYDGIGHYEYWGSKEYDKGHFCVDINEVIYDKSGLTEEEVAQIEEEIASENFSERVRKKYLDQQEAAREDAAEAAHQSREEYFNY